MSKKSKHKVTPAKRKASRKRALKAIRYEQSGVPFLKTWAK